MWTYSQSTGEVLTPYGASAGCGYAGGNIPPRFNPATKNNPAYESMHCFGPLPRGTYEIGAAHDDHHLGPCAMPLTPNPGNVMFGRGGFYIHADSISHPGRASEGCIVLPHQTRLAIAASADRVLEVTS